MYTFNVSAVTQPSTYSLLLIIECECVIMQKSRRSHHFMQAVDSNVAFANAAR